MVELAPSEELYSNPVHPYTKTLLSAIPVPDPIRERKRVLQYYDGEGMENSVWTEVSPGHFAMLPGLKERGAVYNVDKKKLSTYGKKMPGYS